MDNLSKEYEKGFGDACCDHTYKLQGKPEDSDYNQGYHEGYLHTHSDADPPAQAPVHEGIQDTGNFENFTETMRIGIDGLNKLLDKAPISTLGDALNKIDELVYANEALKQDKAKLLAALEIAEEEITEGLSGFAAQTIRIAIKASKDEVSVALAEAKQT